EGRAHHRPDGTTIKGLGGAKYDATTSERTIEDAAGKHEEYVGAVTHDVDPTWLARLTGDEKVHSDMQLIARQENDEAAGYTLEAQVGGGSGAYTRNKLQSLFFTEEHWDESKVKKAHSGEWTVTADIDPEAIANLVKYNRHFKGKS